MNKKVPKKAVAKAVTKKVTKKSPTKTAIKKLVSKVTKVVKPKPITKDKKVELEGKVANKATYYKHPEPAYVKVWHELEEHLTFMRETPMSPEEWAKAQAKKKRLSDEYNRLRAQGVKDVLRRTKS